MFLPALRQSRDGQTARDTLSQQLQHGDIVETLRQSQLSSGVIHCRYFLSESYIRLSVRPSVNTSRDVMSLYLVERF